MLHFKQQKYIFLCLVISSESLLLVNICLEIITQSCTVHLAQSCSYSIMELILEWQVVAVLILGILTALLWPKLEIYKKKLENRRKIKQKREEVRTRKAALEEL